MWDAEYRRMETSKIVREMPNNLLSSNGVKLSNGKPDKATLKKKSRRNQTNRRK